MEQKEIREFEAQMNRYASASYEGDGLFGARLFYRAEGMAIILRELGLKVSFDAEQRRYSVTA